MNSKLSVLCVDDSALIRQMLSDILNQHPRLEVIGIARDGESAIEKIQKLRPSVVTMDVDMPKLDGLQALRRIMRECPVPVVMISSQTREGASATIQALSCGAVDYIPKPNGLNVRDLEAQGREICEKVVQAACANIKPMRSAAASNFDARPPQAPPPMARSLSNIVIAVGVSTGGPAALGEVIPKLPANCPPIVIVQHMPPGFTGPMAERLDKISALRVKEAEHGEKLDTGCAYIAPGDYHLTLVRRGGNFHAEINQSALRSGHRPSADVLFESVARIAGSRAVGVIMTGMGRDGATGLKLMKDKGAATMAQDEATSVVWGMPKQALDKGATARVVPLQGIAQEVLNLLLHIK